MAWLILLSGILNLFLGLIVWLRDLKNRLNLGFGIFSLSTVVLILFDFFFRFNPTVFILKSSYAFAALVPITALIWILEMCHIDASRFSPLRKILIFLPGLVFFVLTYIGNLIVVQVHSLTLLGYIGKLGPLFSLYSLYFFVYILAFIILLYRTQRNTTDRIYKIQIRFVLTGVILYGLTAVTSSLILPKFFGVFDFTLLDAPSLIFFVGFTAYAILKLHLFNIKVIATELLVFALSSFSLIRTIVSDQLNDQIINGGIFLCILIVGVFLIRSVMQEVEQREKIEKLAKQLEKANERLKELDKLKTEFISFATHQLRAPITAIKGYTSEILQGDFGQLPENLRAPTEVIMQSSSSLAILVDDYLNVSRIEQGKMKYEFSDFNLADLVNEVANEQRPSVEKKGLKLEFASPADKVMIHADRGKIKQVILNLLDNSMKYTPAGQITITLTKQDSKARLSIKDTGAGIKPETMSHLFQKFSRASDASKYNLLGTGLGLYLASELLKAHHGRIWAESEGESKGSTFFVDLPAI
ncbi:MAG: ATP-binding protein [Candidatus Paceibacterota bacterium]|jgi:signal transduction histidine kinase